MVEDLKASYSSWYKQHVHVTTSGILQHHLCCFIQMTRHSRKMKSNPELSEGCPESGSWWGAHTVMLILELPGDTSITRGA